MVRRIGDASTGQKLDASESAAMARSPSSTRKEPGTRDSDQARWRESSTRTSAKAVWSRNCRSARTRSAAKLRHEDSFRAMDTDIDVLIESESSLPPVGAFAGARLLFDTQEERFSRFRPGSLLSRLNAGHAVDDAWLAA